LGLQMTGYALSPFPFCLGEAHGLPLSRFRIFVIISDILLLTRGLLMISYPVTDYRMRCCHEHPLPRSANPGDRLLDRGNVHPGNRAADWHSPRYDHAPWPPGWARLRRASRPRDGSGFAWAGSRWTNFGRSSARSRNT